MINICIADNQPVVIQGIKSFFKNHTNITFCDPVFHLDDIQNALISKMVHILLIDIELEGLHNIYSLKNIVKEFPHTKLLIYTSASERLFGMTTMKLGFAGFVSKRASMRTIEKAILNITDGEIVFSEFILKAVCPKSKISNDESIIQKLSIREGEILKYLIIGKKNHEISELLNLSAKTVSTYKLRLLSKFNVTNLIDLVQKAKPMEQCSYM